MPSKDALRELQLRLANRLQAARERPREAGWLAVECAQVGLLLPLAQAGEIHAARQAAPVPHAKPWMVGVANLRGQLNTVIDLGSFLQLRQPIAPGAPRTGAQLVMLNPSLRVNAAILVDRLAGLRDTEQLERLPEASEPRPGFAGATWRDAQGRVWQELDLAALVQDPQFLDVAA
jgi:twitching motility protein PilI